VVVVACVVLTCGDRTRLRPPKSPKSNCGVTLMQALLAFRLPRDG
jgi:hypothetical protein